MKKTIISSILFASVFLNVSESFAKSEYKTKKHNFVVGCGAWQPITGRDGAVIGEFRECKNIFGTKRLEIVHFH